MTWILILCSFAVVKNAKPRMFQIASAIKLKEDPETLLLNTRRQEIIEELMPEYPDIFGEAPFATKLYPQYGCLYNRTRVIERRI